MYNLVRFAFILEERNRLEKRNGKDWPPLSLLPRPTDIQLPGRI